MITTKTIRVVEEDACVGNGCKSYLAEFHGDYTGVPFPFTVSFYDEGEYKVRIEGNKAFIVKL